MGGTVSKMRSLHDGVPQPQIVEISYPSRIFVVCSVLGADIVHRTLGMDLFKLLRNASVRKKKMHVYRSMRHVQVNRHDT